MEDWIWVLIPLTALMIPIVVALTKHQQKMAEILHRNSGDHEAIDRLSREVAELKSLVHQQTINIDSLAGSRSAITPPTPPRSIEERLGG